MAEVPEDFHGALVDEFLKWRAPEVRAVVAFRWGVSPGRLRGEMVRRALAGQDVETAFFTALDAAGMRRPRMALPEDN